MKILVVEDDAGVGRFVEQGLRIERYDVDWLRSGKEVINHLQTGTYAAMVLDLMLPDADGYDICERVRAMGITTPICILTARDDLHDKLDGFQVGADDYLTKPFSIQELLARLNAIIRRSADRLDTATIDIGALRIDLSARDVKMAGKKVSLTQREFDVLLFLARNANRVVTREQLLQGAWNPDTDVTLNTVDVYVGYLRRKLMKAGKAPSIETIYGMGFKLS